MSLYCGLEELYVKKRYRFSPLGNMQFQEHPFAPIAYKVLNPHQSKENLAHIETAPWLMWEKLCFLEACWKSREKAIHLEYGDRFVGPRNALLKRLHDCYTLYINQAVASELRYEIDHNCSLKFFDRQYFEYLLERLVSTLESLLCSKKIRVEKDVQEKAAEESYSSLRKVHFQQDLETVSELIRRELKMVKNPNKKSQSEVIEKIKKRIARERIKIHYPTTNLFVTACRQVSKQIGWCPSGKGARILK